MAYDSSYAPIAPAPMLATLGVEETKSTLKLGEKERLELREVLRLSIGDRVHMFSEEDLDDLGTTFLEATVIALKAKQSQKKTLSEVP